MKLTWVVYILLRDLNTTKKFHFDLKRIPEPEGNLGLVISKVIEMWLLGSHELPVLENSWVSASPSACPAPSLPAPLVPRHSRLQGQGSCGIRSVSPSLCLSLTFPPALSLCASHPQPGCGELPLDSQVPGQLGLLGMGGVSVLSGVMCKSVGAMEGQEWMHVPWLWVTRKSIRTSWDWEISTLGGIKWGSDHLCMMETPRVSKGGFPGGSDSKESACQ